MQGGQLRERFGFDKRVDESQASPPGDGAGNFDGDWLEQFECWGRLMPVKGREEVLAARLTGTQPFVVSIRYSQASRQVTPGWRARHIASGDQFNIHSIANFDERAGYLDLLCVRGEAVG